MKVIQVISKFDIGGAERVAINIAKSKSEDFKYYIVEVIKGNSDFSTELKEELRNNNIIYLSSPIKNRKLAICLFWCWFIWKYLSIKPDIIHSHTEIPDLALWIFRKLSWIFFWIKPQYIRTIHNTELWNEWKFIGKIVEQYYIKHNCNIAISSSTQNCYKKEFGGGDIPIIYNGLEIVEQKEFPYLVKGKINILFAGRFEPQKGIDVLIEVITRLKNEHQFIFHIIGNGSMKDKILSSLNGMENVRYYDKIYGLSSYIGSFDFLFMPSNHEGLALMPIEASLSRTPTIINNCPGLKDTLPDNWILSVNNNSVNAFIELFNKLECLNYNKLSESAYDYAKKVFLINKMQKNYEQYYKSIK